jgi:hypothetical protein
LKFQTWFKSLVAQKDCHGEIALLRFMRRGIKEISSVKEMACQGKERHLKARKGMSSQGMERHQVQGKDMAWHEKSRQGKAWHVNDMQGMDCQGKA